MPLDTLFSLASMLATIGWLTLAALPRSPSARTAAGVGVPIVLALVYVALIVRYLPGAPGGFGSLQAVATLFATPGLLLAGWIHYLAFDLFIGGWETRDAVRHGVPRLLVIPCLFLTFMLGPIGLLAYLSVRAARVKSFGVELS